MITTMSIKTYTELSKISSFIERYRYLKLQGSVGTDTFGYDRYLNQQFYKSKEWKRVRDEVIIRDNGCDLGVDDRDINTRIFIHHMNPISKRDIIESSEYLLDPEYLICVSKQTHDAIHYGDEQLLYVNEVIERSPNDTCPWR